MTGCLATPETTSELPCRSYAVSQDNELYRFESFERAKRVFSITVQLHTSLGS